MTRMVLAFVFCAVLLGGNLWLGMVPAAQAAQKMNIRLAHVVNEQDGFHIAALKFKEIVEERTGGNVTVALFPNAQLGDERTLLEGMQMGIVDMGVITNGPVANFVEEIAVFELPFLFPNPEAAYKVLDGPIGRELLNNLERVNLKGLAYAERGFRNLTNSVRPVNSPEDIVGLKIRVMENPVYIDTFTTLGANAVPMAWTEALTAMRQKTIDGQENPVNVIHSFKLFEQQSHLSMTRHTYAPAIFVMGLAKWRSLGPDYQEIFLEAAQQAAEHGRHVNAEMEAGQLEELREAGMEIIMEPDVAAFREKVKPVHAKYGEKFGAYLQRILDEIQ
ncbi:tripartite ATP-independent transporter solute receptor, DctP family [Desulfonatronum thiosulfatophilum]|uniref:Tripartite ATP-independent transporter solute receptor, DctP family n=1 Tax=Desulfonatronum thiosulfatophilum TaxID=617002 RepID=A0A1G6CWD6_9BACT|nr:TRAP transporter substrate-binding protein [Desulfonatronum thiosulfatophilum]SDB37186.1 tripartite ATP-independent transporter solute receptor, DctP family [Desulfonatronum thiosulfatophilum]